MAIVGVGGAEGVGVVALLVGADGGAGFVSAASVSRSTRLILKEAKTRIQGVAQPSARRHVSTSVQQRAERKDVYYYCGTEPAPAVAVTVAASHGFKRTSQQTNQRAKKINAPATTIPVRDTGR